MRPSGSPHELEERRLRAIHLLGEGFSPVEGCTPGWRGPTQRASVESGLSAGRCAGACSQACFGSAATLEST